MKISDEAFEEAKNVFANSSDVKKEYSEYVAKVDFAKYEASDFPVSEICGVFAVAHCVQEEKNGIPAELRLGEIEIGRKDRGLTCNNVLKGGKTGSQAVKRGWLKE